MELKLTNILDFFPSNRVVYNRLLTRINAHQGIMPFIGYDLISFNYGPRENFLEHLIVSNGLEKQRDKLISEDYLKSLDRILDAATLGVADYREFLEWSLFEEYYSSDKIDRFRAAYEPINLIQWFNNGSVITVNFDKMYELLNNNRKVQIATPKNKRLINHFLREDSSVESLIFKIHGDLFSDKKEMILSESEFLAAYKDSEFISKLKQWINKYVLLFVGIDIRKDKYLKLILDQTKQEGVNHIAIIGCEDDQEAKKKLLQDYTNMHIMPLIYDISKPDSVRILLHKLLVDSQNSEWKKSFTRGTLHYLYNDQLIVGRDEQINELKSFLQDKRLFLFCTINGKNIVGKSKLAFEFAQTYASNWRWYMIAAAEISEFLNFQPGVFGKLQQRQNTLIIFDDYHLFSGSLDEISEFIFKIKRYCLKIRVIFISNTLKESNFRNEMSLDSYNIFYSKDNIYENFYLKLYDINELLNISLNYVLFRKEEFNLNNKEIETWKSVVKAPLRQYISEIVSENPHEALLFSMVYAIKLTLNYLNITTSDTDYEYVYNEVLSYEVTESRDAEGIHVEKVNKLKLHQNKNFRIDRIKKQYEKMKRNSKNINNDIRTVFINEKEFQNKFEGNEKDRKNFWGTVDEDE